MKKQSNKKPIFLNLADGNDEDDDDEDNDLIEIKLSLITIQINSILLYKYSTLFREKFSGIESRNYLSEQILQFQCQYGINEDNTILFFKLLKNENVSITNDNYRDLRKLSEYFKVKKLNRLLDKYSQNYLSDVDSIILQIFEQNQNKILDQYDKDDICIEMEQKLSSKVNECLQNIQFEKLPITSIYRILSKSEKSAISSDILFDFINKSLNQRLMLFHFINISNLSDDRFEMLYENFVNSKNPHFLNSNIPIDLKYIKSIRDENKNLKEIENSIVKRNNELNEKLSKQNKKNSQLKSQNDQLKSEIDRIEKENNQHKSQNDQLKAEIDRLRKENSHFRSKSSNKFIDNFDKRNNKIIEEEDDDDEEPNYDKISNDGNESNQFKIIQNSFSDSSIETLDITFNNDVTILSNTFNRCISLKSITFHSNKKISIEENNFNELTNLEKLEIEGSEIIIGDNCFKTCFMSREQSPKIKDQMIKIDGKSAVEIGNKNFNSLEFLKAVNITGSKIKIGNDCFENCKSLSTFEIFDTDYFSIGKNEFKNCIELENLFLSSEKMKIGSNCFSSSTLSTIEINSDELFIGKKCFYGLSSIKNITISSSKEINISDDLFLGCDKLEILIIKSESSLKFSNSIFRGIQSLKKVLIDSPKVLIGEFCFMNCKSLNSISFQNMNEAEFLSQSFSNCESLSDIKIESYSSLRLDKFCFLDSQNLSFVELISESISINERCFENCNKFKKFSITKSKDVFFEPFCFSGLMNLPLFDISCEQLKIESNCFLKCKSLHTFSLDNVQNAVFNQNSFNECTNLQNISIKNANSINFAEQCFTGLNSLKSIDIQSDEISFTYRFINLIKSLTTIKFNFVQKIELNSNMFDGCDSLNDIEIISQNSITLKSKCFIRNKNLQFVKFKSNQITIEDECFLHLHKLNTVTFDCQIVEIGKGSFKNCISLSSFNFNNAETVSIGSNSFSGYSKLNKLNISASSEIKLSEYCFCGTMNLESITLRSAKVTLGKYCFKGCPILKNIRFSNVQEATLDCGVLEQCDSLNYLNLAATTKLVIRGYCFSGATNLKGVRLYGSILNIGSFIFKDCEQLAKVSLESTIDYYIPKRAYYGCPINCNIDESKLRYKK